MRLTPEQQSALAQAHATCPARGNSAIHYFLAGIECERARAAKEWHESIIKSQPAADAAHPKEK